MVIFGACAHMRVAQNGQVRPTEAKSGPRAAKSGPRAAKGGPRAAKSALRVAQSAPRAARRVIVRCFCWFYDDFVKITLLNKYNEQIRNKRLKITNNV